MQSDDLEEAEVNKFTNRITRDWGEEESQLRSAIYVSFLKDKDVELLRKRQTRRISTSDSRTNSLLSSKSDPTDPNSKRTDRLSAQTSQ